MEDIYVAAGCQKGFLNSHTAMQMAFYMLEAIQSKGPSVAPFIARITHRERGAVFHRTFDTILIDMRGFSLHSGGVPTLDFHSPTEWKLEIIPNPDEDMLQAIFDMLPKLHQLLDTAGEDVIDENDPE